MTTQKSKALVKYPIHAILLNVSLRKRQWMTDNGHTQVGFLRVCCCEEEVEKNGSCKGDVFSVYGSTSFMTVTLERGVHITGNLE